MEKIGCMLETPQVSWWYSSVVGTIERLEATGSENPSAMRTISREVLSAPVSRPELMTPQRLHADAPILYGEFQAYLQGALYDGTFNRLHSTHRIAQKGRSWLERLQCILLSLGFTSWIYQEGKTRDEMYVLETKASFLDVAYNPHLLASDGEQIVYVRGYFDADGGMPRSLDVKPFQIQYVQKDRIELMKVRDILLGLGISCGKMHNPSMKVDADYRRFFISIPCNKLFARRIGSWHPRKEQLLGMMI